MPSSEDPNAHDLSSRIKKSHDDYTTRLREMEDRHNNSSNNNNIATPLAAFKRFIDDHISTLTSHLVNLPSNISSLRSDIQAENAALEREFHTRWTASAETAEALDWEIYRLPSRAKDDITLATRWMIEHAARENSEVPWSRIAALYADGESAQAGWLDGFGGGKRISPRWLSVDWFARSAYSPLRLEMHEDLQWEGKKWRAAFEDLMAASLGKEMVAQQHREVDCRSGVHWMLSLQDRGVLPPLLPMLYDSVLGRRECEGMSLGEIIKMCHGPWRSTSSWRKERDGFMSDPMTHDFTELRRAFATREIVEDALDEYAGDTELDMYSYQGNSALEEYQQQLELLQEQNNRRLLMARAEKRALGNHDDDDACEEYDDLDDDDDDDDDDDNSCPFANEYRVHALEAHQWDMLRQSAGFLLTGDRTSDFESAVSALGAALQRSDANDAAKILNTWYEHYQDLKIVAPGIVDATPHVDWDSVRKAMDWTRIPSLEGTGSIEELMRTLGCFEGEGLGRDEGLRGELYRRLARVLEGSNEKRGVGWLRYAFMPLEELEENLQALEQQKESLLGGKQVLKTEEVPARNIPSPRPDVLSALTTTHTTRLPDGTVTTKVVLKKRFVDGREECSESVHTIHEAVVGKELRREGEGVEEDKTRKSRGWFWT